MSARSKARKRALDVLYAADTRNIDPVTVLGERLAASDYTPIGEYAETLVRGVADHQHRIDDLLIEHVEGWTLPRMPAVDRAILRIAVYELIWSDDVPTVTGELGDPALITSHRDVTDAHLLALAQRHGGTLVTFDSRIERLLGSRDPELLSVQT